MRVELPNGTIIDDIPEGTARDEIMQKAIAAGFAKQEDFPEEKSVFQSVSDFVTGDDRATELTDRLPEIGTGSGLLGGEDKAKVASITPALMSTIDPNGIVEVITNNFENVGVAYNKDAQGNTFPILRNNKTGAVAQVNKPGMSALDVLQGIGLAAAFTPAGRAGLKTTGALAGAAKVGLASGVTQGGLNAVQQASGREASLSEIGQEVGFATVGGFVFENLFRATGAGWKAIAKRIQNGQVDDKTREFFTQQATKLGIPADDITDDYIKQAANDATDAFGGDLSALENEFKVRLTNAQRSGNQAALSAEDSIRAGMRGGKAQDVFLKGEATQNAQISKAAASMQDDIARGSDIISTRQEAGAALKQGVENLEQVANDSIEAAYSKVGEASLSADGFQQLLKATKNATRSVEFPKSDKVAPAYAALRKDLVTAETALSKAAKSENMRLKPVHIRHVEGVRRSIGKYMDAAANQTDRRNIMATRQAFDDYLDKAVIKGLFEGDTASIESLKTGRAVFRDYMKKFSPRMKITRLGKSKDPAGEFISKIILDNPTDEQVMNSLFTVGGFNKPSAARMAHRFKELLGPDSQEWNMVRQAAFKQLIKTNNVNGGEVISGAKTLTAMSKAMESNDSLMKQLFSPQELRKMRRFATLVKRATPDIVKSRENASGTSQKAVKEVGNYLQRFLPFMDGGTIAVTTGVGVMKNRASVKAAESAFRPFSKLNRGAGMSVIEGGLIGQSGELGPAARSGAVANAN